MKKDTKTGGSIWDEQKTLWCNRCQDNTPHVRRVLSPFDLLGCLAAPAWWFLARQLDTESRGPARCTVCGRLHTGRVVRKRDRPSA